MTEKTISTQSRFAKENGSIGISDIKTDVEAKDVKNS